MNRFQAILLAQLLLFTSCNAEVPKLPNGFEVVVPNRYQYSICNSKRVIVVSHNITEISIIREFVIGFTDIPKMQNLQTDAIKGYFILNTLTGKVLVALDRKRYLEGLTAIQVSESQLKMMPPG